MYIETSSQKGNRFMEGASFIIPMQPWGTIGNLNMNGSQETVSSVHRPVRRCPYPAYRGGESKPDRGCAHCPAEQNCRVLQRTDKDECLMRLNLAKVG